MDVTATLAESGVYQRPLLRLRFDDDEFDGLIVRCRRPNIDDVLALYRLRRYADRPDDGDLGDGLDEMFAAVAGLIKSWNLVDDDEIPVPVTGAGLRGQDFAFVTALIGAVLGATVGVARPLGRPSPGGEPSREASIPMEPLSPSPESLPAPD